MLTMERALEPIGCRVLVQHGRDHVVEQVQIRPADGAARYLDDIMGHEMMGEVVEVGSASTAACAKASASSCRLPSSAASASNVGAAISRSARQPTETSTWPTRYSGTRPQDCSVTPT